jgi:hypothetical protein
VRGAIGVERQRTIAAIVAWISGESGRGASFLGWEKVSGTVIDQKEGVL